MLATQPAGSTGPRPATNADRALLWAIARALHPDDSVASLAGDLDVDKRTLSRMMSPTGWHGGGWPIPPGIWRELAALVETRAAGLVAAARRRAGP